MMMLYLPEAPCLSLLLHSPGATQTLQPFVLRERLDRWAGKVRVAAVPQLWGEQVTWEKMGEGKILTL